MNIMKKTIRPNVSYLGLIAALCAMLISGCSCSAPKSTPDPLAGFHPANLYNPDSHKAITDDYKDYISKLPPIEKKYASVDNYFEDGTGQHVVQIVIPLNGTFWEHDLFYDKDDKRIKVIKRITGSYQS